MKFRELAVLWITMLASFGAYAVPVTVSEFATFLVADELESGGLYPGVRPVDVTGQAGPTALPAGISTSFSFSGCTAGASFDCLGDSDVASLTVEWVNNTGADLTDVGVVTYLDADILDFGNEIGVGPPGDSDATSWSIDDPFFRDQFFDAEENLLGNINWIDFFGDPAGDVALALGFDLLTNVLAGESIIATFELSRFDNGGLLQSDLGLDESFYFDGSVIVEPVAVPEPSTLGLLGAGLLFGALRRRRSVLRQRGKL